MPMLRWLTGRRSPSTTQLLTDDPLATISANLAASDHADTIYAVTRVNPLYEDERSLAWDGAPASLSPVAKRRFVEYPGPPDDRGPGRRDRAASAERDRPAPYSVTRVPPATLPGHGHRSGHGHQKSSSREGRPDVDPAYIPPRPVWPGLAEDGYAVPQVGVVGSADFMNGIRFGAADTWPGTMPAGDSGSVASVTASCPPFGSGPLLGLPSGVPGSKSGVGDWPQEHLAGNENSLLWQSAGIGPDGVFDSIVTESLLLLTSPEPTPSATLRPKEEAKVDGSSAADQAVKTISEDVPIIPVSNISSLRPRRDQQQPLLQNINLEPFSGDKTLQQFSHVLTNSKSLQLARRASSEPPPSPSSSSTSPLSSEADFVAPSRASLVSRGGSLPRPGFGSRASLVSRGGGGGSLPRPGFGSSASLVSRGGGGGSLRRPEFGSRGSLGRPNPESVANPIAFVLRLWERTGLRTNGRRLLLNEPDGADDRPAVPPVVPRHRLSRPGSADSHVYSEIASVDLRGMVVHETYALPPAATAATPGTDYFNQLLPSSVTSGSSAGSERHSGSGSERGSGSEGGSERRVTFSADTVDNERSRPRPLYEAHGVEPTRRPQTSPAGGDQAGKDRDRLWNGFYGANVYGSLAKADGKTEKKGDWHERGSFTLDAGRTATLQRRAERRRRARRCWLLAVLAMVLAVLLAALVLVSWYSSSGKRWFGAL